MNWICIEYLIFIVLDYDVEEAKNSSIDVFRNSVAVIKKDTDPPVSLLREDNYFAVSKQAGGNPPRREQYGRAFRLKWLISTWCHQAKCCLFFCLFVSFFLSSFLPCVLNVFVSPHPQFCLRTSSSTGCEFRRGPLFVLPPCALFSALITMPVPFYPARWLEEEGVWE